MGDLSALTAKTGSEFALFTKRGERLIVRGGRDNTPINVAEAKRLSKEGYRWSGHTHPGRGEVVRLASPADKAILQAFRQKNSVVYDAVGIAEPFGEDYP
jgi:choline dehydrogenase-like flavoprotein